ncbi:MAG TPA: YiiD C-terminal domain-containing protein [Chitinophagaceae bacterium]|jgi:acyl-coenzyme A thioesterase PaaI-like protein|nr:YiiD C-terminal domain-containing protein [Chitinophagaceae bacterium]
MKAILLPFTKKIGIKHAQSNEYLLQLDFNEHVTNHIGTTHASASYALAETTSGVFLEVNFAEIAERTIPILRASSVKYKKGGLSTLYSNAKLIGTNITEVTNLLLTKKKAMFVIHVKLYNENKEVVMVADFEWFVTLKP